MQTRIIITALLFLIVSALSYAQQFVGADMYYTYLGNNDYKITLHAYKECGKPGFILPQISAFYSAEKCGDDIINTQSTPLIKSNEQIVACINKDVKSICEGGQDYGLIKIKYEGVISLNKKCNKWRVWAVQLCDRVNTTNLKDEECITAEVEINNQNLNINSIDTASVILSGQYCKGQTISISQGISPTSNDSLLFELVSPINSKSEAYLFENGFNANSPITSTPAFNIDRRTGVLSFNSSTVQSSFARIKIENYKNNDTILKGITYRDFALDIIDCGANTTPSLSGFNNLSKTLKLCNNDTSESTYYINAIDPDINSTAFITIDRGSLPPEINISLDTLESNSNQIDDIRIKVIWDSDEYAVAPDVYSFTAKVEDEFCDGQSYIFQIEVLSSPKIQLPDIPYLQCDSLLPQLGLKVKENLINPTYIWNTGATSPSISDVSTGIYTLIVKNNNGCADTATTNIKGPLVPDFKVDTLCPSITSFFVDKSEYKADSGKITTWEWDYGDGTSYSYTGDDLSRRADPNGKKYLSDGIYNVKLKITDDKGCQANVEYDLAVCDPSNYDFQVLDSCERSRFLIKNIIDLEPCETNDAFNTSFYETIVTNKNSENEIDAIRQNWPDTGKYNINVKYYPRYTVTLKNFLIQDKFKEQYNYYGCPQEKDKEINIYKHPTIRSLQDNFIWSCIRPDTIISAIASGGTPPYTINWSKERSSIGSVTPLLSTDTAATITYSGIYKMEVKDANNCPESYEIVIDNPIDTLVDISPYCISGSDIKFTDLSNSTHDIKKRTWDLGMNNITKTDSSFLFRYADDSVYFVTLYLEDNTGCIDSIPNRRVIQTIPDFTFDIVNTEDSLCFFDDVIIQKEPFYPYANFNIYMGDDSAAYLASNEKFVSDINESSPFILNKIKFTHDQEPISNVKYIFTMDEVRPFKVPKEIDKKEYLETIAESIYSEGYAYFRYNLQYNFKCDTAFIDSIYIYEKHIDSVGIAHQCIDSINRIEFMHLQGRSIKNFEWNITHGDIDDPSSSTTYIGSNSNTTIDTVFTKEAAYDTRILGLFDTTYFANYKYEDVKGCIIIDTFLFRAGNFPNTRLDLRPPCINTSISLQPFPLANYYKNFFFKVGDSLLPGSIDPIKYYKIDKTGNYPVKLKILNLDDCVLNIDTVVSIYENPKPKIGELISCIGDSTLIEDQTETPSNSPIVNYKWVYDNDRSSNSFSDHNYLFFGLGKHVVSMYVEDANGCSDSLINHPVQIIDSAISNFSWEETDALNDPLLITFNDQSENTNSIQYIFTETDKIKTNPGSSNDFRFPLDTVYHVLQIVTNEGGCIDTLKKRLDLASHFLLPTAFSPNEDQLNDDFGPIYNRIYSLDEFQIFNRWGEKVFDSEGDLNRRWNGSFRGQPQPSGTYIYHYKAITIFNDLLEGKGKVVLIR